MTAKNNYNGSSITEERTLENKLKKLINAHWEYIEQLLKIHKEDEITINKIKFHYTTAFEHGYKHAKEEKESSSR